MDSKSGSIQTKTNRDTSPTSSSGLELDPDPLDSIKVLHGSRKTMSGNLFERIFSRLKNAAMQAVDAVFNKFFVSDPTISISAPRYIRRNEDELTPEMKEANDAARANYYAKLIKGEPVQVVPANTKPQVQDSTSPSLAQVSDTVEEKPTDVSAGEKTFQQYFTLFQEKEGNLSISSGYFALTPECIDYANKLTETAIGKTVDKMPNAAKIKAAKALLEGERTIRQEQKQQAAIEAKHQAKLAKQELEKTMLPGQSDFEKFFAMYEKHENENTNLVIYEDSKFLAEDCLIYANIISREQPSSDQAKAAEYLSKWNAAGADALKGAKASQTFQAPQPPVHPPARVRPGTTEVLAPLPAWEAVALDLQSLSDEEREKLASITRTSSDKLNQVLKGLRLVSIASTKKDATIVEGGTSQRAGFRSRWPDGSPTVIDDLQQAQIWLKFNANNAEKQLDAYPNIKAILESSPRIREVIDEQLSLLAPEPKKDNAKAESRLTELSLLSDEEIARGGKDFNEFVKAFAKAQKEGRVIKLATNSKYLDAACLVVANDFYQRIAGSKSAVVVDADMDMLLAAGFLKSTADQRANKSEATKGGQQ